MRPRETRAAGLKEPGAGWVVLVEDDPAVAQMYRLGLEMRGFKVTVAASGEAMFRSLNGRAPDVIVLDYQLPGHNGAEVLEMIREHDTVRAAPVFMLSNFPPTHEGAIDRVIRLGAMGWFEKTRTSPQLLAEKLEHALRQYAPSRSV